MKNHVHAVHTHASQSATVVNHCVCVRAFAKFVGDASCPTIERIGLYCAQIFLATPFNGLTRTHTMFRVCQLKEGSFQ